MEVNGEENEGERSEISRDSTVFVPSPSASPAALGCLDDLIVSCMHFCCADLPVPQNLRVTAFSNASVALAWNYPIQDFYVPILSFKVQSCSAASLTCMLCIIGGILSFCVLDQSSRIPC